MLNHLNSLACSAFLVGSILFLPSFADYAVAGVWCFITGSATMLVTNVLQARG